MVCLQELKGIETYLDSLEHSLPALRDTRCVVFWRARHVDIRNLFIKPWFTRNSIGIEDDNSRDVVVGPEGKGVAECNGEEGGKCHQNEHEQLHGVG